jgi:hypothetical protein
MIGKVDVWNTAAVMMAYPWLNLRAFCGRCWPTPVGADGNMYCGTCTGEC